MDGCQEGAGSGSSGVDKAVGHSYNPDMAKSSNTALCLVVSLLLLAACGGEEVPATAVPQEEPTAVPAATEPAPSVPASDKLAHEFAQGTQLLSLDEAGLVRNPIMAATDEGFRWGALVSRDGEAMWVIDGEVTPLGGGEVSDFAVNGDLSRYAYVSNDVVFLDGEQVDQGQTGCCPVFSRDGSSFGYIAGGSFVVLDGVPQDPEGGTVEQLLLSSDGSKYAYIVGGDTVVVNGEKQKSYDRVSDLTFSPDGSRFAYTANDNLLVVDGEEREIEENTAGQIAFSPNGSNLAYVKGDASLGRVFLDDKELKRYPFGCGPGLLPWTCFTFTSDGSRLAYTTPLLSSGGAGTGGQASLQYRVVQDGVRESNSLGCCLVVGPEGAHLAYVSVGFSVVVDGQRMESAVASLATGKLVFIYEMGLDVPGGLSAADLVFSVDGKSLALLLYETDPNQFITKVFLETMDVP